MTAQPTVEDYLAQNADSEDLDDETFTPLGLDPAMPPYTPPPSTDPLVMMAQSLETIAQTFTMSTGREELWDEVEKLRWELEERERVIDEILAVCKKSTSKLAISVREVINGPAAAEPEAAPEPDADLKIAPEPADDATVEEWRAFAASFGLEGTDQMNRSQIRTALGIAQPVQS